MVREPEVTYAPVPPLADVLAASGSNGLTAASTFSGCGGGCLGLEWAGFDLRYASEFVPAAADTYEANHPGVVLDRRDVRETTAADVLEACAVDRGDLDLFEGSPPCSPFSNSGSRDAGWGKVKAYSDVKQRTDDLFDEFVRLVDGVAPRAFYAENVPAITTGRSRGFFLALCETLAAQAAEFGGYRITPVILDSSWLGVPQRRHRLFIVGIRADVEAEFAPPTPTPSRAILRGAFDGLDPVRNLTDPETGERIGFADAAIGAEWRRLRKGAQSSRYFNLIRPTWDEPSPTVTQTGGQRAAASVTHPDEPRKYALTELRRVCGFPDDFVLTGTYRQRYERLGRAVSPPVSRALGVSLARTLRKEAPCP